MSHGYMMKLEDQLKAVPRLLKLAEQADAEDALEVDIPEELKRRETRIARIKEAKKALEERAKERHEQEKAEYEKKMQEREENEKRTGKKTPGKKPSLPVNEGSKAKDQYNFTDPESRIMKTSDGFDQCYNAQAAVNEDMLILGAYANNYPNDKNELLPTIASIPEELGKPPVVLADHGYCSEENLRKCAENKVDAYIAAGRMKHNQALDQIIADWDPIPIDQESSILDQMKQKLRTIEGKAAYRLRKMTVEPVFGIIKEVMGFQRFSLRGEAQENAEWILVYSAYKLKRMFNMKV